MNIQDVIQMSDGNSGTINALITILAHQQCDAIIDRLNEYDIKGGEIYILYSDVCNGDISMMHYILNNAPKDKIIESAKSQEYLGRTLLSQWVDEFNN